MNPSAAVRFPSLRSILIALTLSATLTAGSMLLQGHIGLNLADEGHLWYGAIRTAAGEIPTLDFRSYDPARYYWIAAWTPIFGKGVIGMRAAGGVFQFIGLFFALRTVQRVNGGLPWQALTGVILLCWMFPRYKVFEPCLALIAIWAAVQLIEHPTLRNHTFAGFCMGIAAFFGRNHGLYQLIGFGLLLGLMNFQRQEYPYRRWVYWVIGALIGALPLLIMFVSIPGMFEHYVQEYLLVFVRSGATNLSLPIPWFWTVIYSQLALWDAASKFVIGILYLIMPLMLIGILIWLVLRKRHNLAPYSLLVAAGCIGLPYLHHAFDRADTAHLAQSIPAFLMITIGVGIAVQKHRLAAAVVMASLVLMTGIAILPYQPYINYLRRSTNYEWIEIAGERLLIPRAQARYLRVVKAFVQQNLQDEKLIFVAPYAPGLYPILGRQAPVYDPFPLPLGSESIGNQQQMIAELETHQVDWALIDHSILDDREGELGFANTHPLVWAYLQTEFDPVALPDLPDDQTLYRRR